MFLHRLTCIGLFSYGEHTELELMRQTIITGDNNSGKSNLFRIIRLLSETFSKRRRLEQYEVFKDSDISKISALVTLAPDETDRIIDFFSFHTNPERQDIFYHIINKREKLINLLSSIQIDLEWKRDIQRRGFEPNIKIQFQNIDLTIYSDMYGGTYIGEKRTRDSTADNTKPHEFFENLINSPDPRNYVQKFFRKDTNPIIGISDLQANRLNEGGSDHGGAKILTGLLSFLEIKFDYNQNFSLLSIIGKIFNNKIFHVVEKQLQPPSILDYAELLTRQNDNDYNNKLITRAKEISLEYQDELKSNGSNLIQFLFSLKNSTEFERRKKFVEIQKAFHSIVKSESLYFDVILEYDEGSRHRPSSGDIQRNPIYPRLVIIDESLNAQIPISQVGSGLIEIIYLLTVSQDVHNSIILLDEPATNLYTEQIRILIKYLEENNSDNQIIIISHLQIFLEHAKSAANHKILNIRKENGISRLD